MTPDADPIYLAVAFPLYEHDRERLRRLFGGKPLPAPYPRSTERPCDGCALMLSVGPRMMVALQAQPTLQVICPFCFNARHQPGDDIIEISSLGNPDSKYES